MRKLLIVDPTLISLEGHSYNYDRAISTAARKYFDHVEIYAGAGFRPPPDDPTPYRAVLNRVPLERAKRWVNAAFHLLRRRSAPSEAAPRAAAHATLMPNTWRWIIALAEALRARDVESSVRGIVREAGTAGDEIHLLFQHARLCDLVAADRLRGAFGAGPAVHLHLVLRSVSELIDAGRYGEAGFAAMLLRLARSDAPRVHLLTDSERLGAHYSALGVATGTLPVPIIPPGPEGAPAQERGRGIPVAFLGSARVEKGFSALPSLVDALAARGGGVRALVQVNRDTADPRVREATARLEALARRSPGAVELLDSPVPLPTYYSWIRRSGLIVLPYVSPKYNASTSGIFVESICFGVPVICPANSWMSDVVEQAARAHGLRIGETFSGLEDIPGLVERMAREIGRYAADTRAFARAWRETHNPDACVRALMLAAGAPA